MQNYALSGQTSRRLEGDRVSKACTRCPVIACNFLSLNMEFTLCLENLVYGFRRMGRLAATGGPGIGLKCLNFVSDQRPWRERWHY